MKIQNLFFGDSNIRKSDGSGKPQTAAAKSGSDGKMNSLNGASYVREQAETTSFKVEPEFPPRIELVNQIRERIAEGDYDERYVVSVAKKIIELPIVKDVIVEAEMKSSEESANRIDRIEKAREQIVEGHYDDPAVREKIAENLISALGLDSLAQD